jgi:hypothetical protein
VRKALGTLPWVEHASIQTDVNRREVRFNLKEKQAFDANAVMTALKSAGFPVATAVATEAAPQTDEAWPGSGQ